MLNGLMTSKEVVKEKFPGATAYKWVGKFSWIIYANDASAQVLGVQSTTAAKAWASAVTALSLCR